MTSVFLIMWRGKEERSTYLFLWLEGYFITHKAANALTYLFPKGSDKSVYTKRNFVTCPRTIPSVALGDCIYSANDFIFIFFHTAFMMFAIRLPTSQIKHPTRRVNRQRFPWELEKVLISLLNLGKN